MNGVREGQNARRSKYMDSYYTGQPLLILLVEDTPYSPYGERNLNKQ